MRRSPRTARSTRGWYTMAPLTANSKAFTESATALIRQARKGPGVCRVWRRRRTTDEGDADGGVRPQPWAPAYRYTKRGCYVMCLVIGEYQACMGYQACFGYHSCNLVNLLSGVVLLCALAGPTGRTDRTGAPCYLWFGVLVRPELDTT